MPKLKFERWWALSLHRGSPHRIITKTTEKLKVWHGLHTNSTLFSCDLISTLKASELKCSQVGGSYKSRRTLTERLIAGTEHRSQAARFLIQYLGIGREGTQTREEGIYLFQDNSQGVRQNLKVRRARCWSMEDIVDVLSLSMRQKKRKILFRTEKRSIHPYATSTLMCW